ncbi:ATP synthase subunit e, mitochondrial [Planococcus citri]|uniref:ATP synthase subunit e, mitochondrial n=1 Tax=Planococcus citri TaxID=170843 RepID=UPI0031F82230
MDPVVKYGEPGRISPLIRFSRWTALALGISYGVFRSGYIQRRADRLKDLRDKRIAARLERERLEGIEAKKREVAYLEETLGTKFT